MGGFGQKSFWSGWDWSEIFLEWVDWSEIILEWVGLVRNLSGVVLVTIPSEVGGRLVKILNWSGWDWLEILLELVEVGLVK